MYMVSIKLLLEISFYSCIPQLSRKDYSVRYCIIQRALSTQKSKFER